MKQAKMVLGFLSTTLPQAASSLASNFSETIKDPKNWGPAAASVALGLVSEILLIRQLKAFKDLKLKTIVGTGLEQFVLSVATGALAGGAAYLSGLSDQDQAEFIGLVIAALNLTITDVRLFFRARQDTSRAPDTYLLEHQYLNINEGMPESKLSPQDVQFAKSMKKNILAKLPFLYIAGIVIYEATLLIKDKTSGEDNYFTDHAGKMALALPIGLQRIWSAVTPYVVKPAPQTLLPITFAFQ